MDNSYQEIKSLLWDTIITEVVPSEKHSASQLSVRCPFCGDSKKNLNSTHMYIKIDIETEEPILYHCFRCETSGILTPQVLRMLELNDIHLNSKVKMYNKKAVKSIHNSLGSKDNELNIKIPPSKETSETYIRNKKYIEKRLGRTFSFEELERLKVVFQLGDLLRYNEIDKITTYPKKAAMFHTDYVGFLTMRNEFINFRQVDDRMKGKRYEKYSVVPNLDNTRNFYTIPNEIDIMSTDPIIINITEGIFDILGVFYHIDDAVQHNTIHAAACGAGFLNVVQYFIQKGIFGNVIINLYSDSDRGPEYYRKLHKLVSPWVSQINLFYNSIGKDYGVKLNEIKLIKRNIPTQ